MKFITKKMIGLIIALLIVSILAFLAFEIIPGDPARAILGIDATKSSVQALREEMGLNRPLPQRYGQWMLDFLKGDWGISYSYQLPVRELISDKLPITVVVTGVSFLMILFISIPFSLLCARYENKWIDRIFLILNQTIMSIPSFFVGMILTVIFGLTLRWFVPGDYISYKDNAWEFFKYLIFPCLAIALPRSAMTIKIFRNSLIEQLHQDYIRTALSRGNSKWRVLIRHAFGNGLIPIVTFLGMTIADIAASSIVIEQVFGIPGIGRTLISGISNRDYPVVEAIVVWIAVVVLVLNAIVDYIYRRLDKRIEV